MLKEGSREDRIKRLMAISAMGGTPLSYEAAASAIEASDSGKFKGGRTEEFVKMWIHLSSQSDSQPKSSEDSRRDLET